MDNEIQAIVDQINNVDVVVIVCKSVDGAEVEHCVPLGVAVLFDKPIICVMSKGVKIPEKLAKVVDRFVEQRNSKSATVAAVKSAIKNLMS